METHDPTLSRLGDEQELELVRELAREAFPGKSPDGLIAFLRQPNAVCVLLKDGSGNLLAFASALTAADYATVLDIAVKKERRGNGFGKTVTADLLRILGEAGVCDVDLEVRTSNKPAIRLYSSLGFCAVSVFKDYYDSPKEDAYLMKLTIGDSQK